MSDNPAPAPAGQISAVTAVLNQIDPVVPTAAEQALGKPTPAQRKSLAEKLSGEDWASRAAEHLTPVEVQDEGQEQTQEPEPEKPPEKPETEPEKPAPDVSDIERELSAIHEQAHAARQKREARAKYEQERRDFERQRQEFEVQAKELRAAAESLTRLKSGDLSALQELGLDFAQLQQAALTGDVAPKISKLESEITRLAKQLEERTQQEEQTRRQAQMQAAISSYKSDVSKAVSAHPKLSELGEVATQRAIAYAEQYAQRTGQLVDAETLVAYTADRMVEEARTLSRLLSDTQPANSATAPPAKAGGAAVPTRQAARGAPLRFDPHAEDWISQAAKLLTRTDEPDE